MTRYRVEQAAATGLGFFVGSTLAVFIAPMIGNCFNSTELIAIQER
jgi:hypothetical protein